MAFSSARYAAFKTKWRGKRINGWSASGGQCTDAVRRYIQEVLGCKTNTFDWIGAGNAVDFYRLASTRHFRKIANSVTSLNHPIEGDIVVAHRRSQGADGVWRDYGHVFIAEKDCTGYYLRGFGQNWTRYRLCDFEYHPHYLDSNWTVIGWVRAL